MVNCISGWWLNLPLWKIWIRQLGLWHSQYMEKIKHVPNHQLENVPFAEPTKSSSANHSWLGLLSHFCWVLLADFRGKLQGLPDKSGFSSGFSLEEATFLLAKMEFIPKQIRILTAFISGLLLFWPLQRPSVTNDASTTCFHMVRAWLEWFQVFLQPFQWLVVSAQEALPTFAIFSKFYETMMINPCILEPSILTQNHVVDRSSTLGHGDVFKLSILENL